MMHALLACGLALAASGSTPAAATGATGADDEARRLFAAIQPDWESWATGAGTFRKGGTDPGPWTALHPGVDRFELIRPSDFPNLRHIVGGRMLPLADPLSDAQQLIEVRLNAISYDYIRSRDLYTVDGQRRAVAAGPVEFPVGSIQLKAAWRPIRAAERGHYHTMTLHLADGGARLYGLAAVNFAVKTCAGWLWASFEHADASDEHRSRDTVRSYYRLRGTQTNYLDASGRPVRLGNAALEAGLGASASCMTCHARAGIGVAGGAERLPVFAPAPVGIRRGYVGIPDPAWFGHADAEGRWHRTYASLDFVWSLSQAAESGAAQSRGPAMEQRP